MKGIQHELIFTHTKINKIADVYKIGITAGLTSIREVAALFDLSRIILFKSRQSTRLFSRRSYAADRQSVKRD